MIRSELVVRLASQHPGLSAEERRAVVDAILGRIEEALAAGDRVEIRDFGAFTVKRRAARSGRNPRTGTQVTVSEKVSVHFRPGKAMRDLLK